MSLVRFFLVGILLLVFACNEDAKQLKQKEANRYFPESGITVVVLGSSTAAGAGPQRRDSAWAFRLKKKMKRKNPRNRVINLAKGGYTSFHILPNGEVPYNRLDWLKPDSLRNVSRALEFSPDVILLNLPSNDNTLRVPISKQISNLKKIVAWAESGGAQVWITTTQPINRSAKLCQKQKNVCDSIQEIFGGNTLDFWKSLASSEGRIQEEFSAGDGLHINSKGHEVLFNLVKKRVPLDSIYIAKQRVRFLTNR